MADAKRRLVRFCVAMKTDLLVTEREAKEIFFALYPLHTGDW